MDKQLVIFKLSDEYFGVEIAGVESIIKMQAITKVPHTPSFIVGVTNLRGKVLPVVDLRTRFNLPPCDISRDSRIVVVNIGDMEIGMSVDSVSEVLTITDSDIEPAPRMATTIDSNFITGIAKVADRLVILLDLSAIIGKVE